MAKQIVEMSLEELQAYAKNLEDKIGASAEPELRELVKSQEQEIAELRIKLAAVAGEELKKKESVKPVILNEPVNIDGEKWRFRIPAFYFDGVLYTSEEAALQADLLKKIVGLKGQSILKKLI